MTVSAAGAWRWLPLDSELRQDGANLNPELIESTAAEHNWQYHEADEGKPEYKDNAFMRDAAAKGMYMCISLFIILMCLDCCSVLHEVCDRLQLSATVAGKHHVHLSLHVLRSSN